MALPSSGTLTMAQINAEFGRGNNLNAYRGTSYYTSSAGPFTFSSGAISFSDFYGTQLAAPVFSFTISAHQNQANLRTLAVAAGWDQSKPVIATLAAGYYIYSTTTTAALTINGSWPGGVTFVNNGYVMGFGGTGGGLNYNGSAYTYNLGLTAGSNAINLGVSCTIQNNSYIGGGGGGGGFAGNSLNAGAGYPGGGGAGGGTGGTQNMNGTISPGGAGGGIGSSGGNGTIVNGYYSGGGGGRIMPGSSVSSTSSINGGAYYATSTGGGAGNAGTAVQNGQPASGTNTSSTVIGYGGQAGGSGSCYTGNIQYGIGNIAAGGGGGWGASGASSVNSAVAAGQYTGAAGGKCVNLNGYSVTWSATGTRYGAIS